MTFAQFENTLKQSRPPADLTPALAALWWAHNGKWDEAHQIVMDEADKDCAWVHAHLHRVEGDLENARYWYRRARRAERASSLADEWGEIARTLLDPR